MLYLTSCIRPAERVREPGKPDDGNPVCTSMLADVEPENVPHPGLPHAEMNGLSVNCLKNATAAAPEMVNSG